MSRIVITGVTGFIGYEIAKKLKKHDLKALVRKTSNLQKIKDLGISSVSGDLTDPESLKAAFSGADVVVHAAGCVSDWGKKEDFIRWNYIGTKNVVEACIASGVKRLVYLSTVDIFGHQHKSLLTENSPIRKRPGWYGKTKIMAEKFVRECIRENRLAITMIYPSWVYGEGDTHFVPEIIDAIKTNNMMYFRRDGSNTLEIVHVGNVANLVRRVIEADSSIGEGYIISESKKYSIKEFTNILSQKTGYKEVNFWLPYWLSYLAALFMEGFYLLIRSEKRPLLTRHAVTLLGNDIVYDTAKLKTIGFQEEFSFQKDIDGILGKYR